MALFNLFKKNKPKNFFDLSHNEESIHKITTWLKNSSTLIIDVNSNNEMDSSLTKEGKQFVTAYTDVFQRIPSYKKNEYFITIDYKGLVELFEKNARIDYLWINPYSDGVQLNRTVFTAQYMIKENTTVQIGQPENPPIEIIDFLVDYALKEPSIKHIFLALMKNKDEFSYVVFIDSLEKEKIVKKIGPKIGDFSAMNYIQFPIDFVYDNIIKDSKCIIYSKK